MFKPIIGLMALLSLTACGQPSISELPYEERQVRYQQIAAAYQGTPVRVNYPAAPKRSNPKPPVYAPSKKSDPVIINDSPYEFIDNLGNYGSSDDHETIYQDHSVSVVKETPSPEDFYYRRAQ